MNKVIMLFLLLASTYCIAQDIPDLSKGKTFSWIEGTGDITLYSTVHYDTAKVRMLYDTLMPIQLTTSYGNRHHPDIFINGWLITKRDRMGLRTIVYWDENKRVLNNDKVWLAKTFNW